MAYLTGDLVVLCSYVTFKHINFVDFLWLGLRQLQISVFDSRFLLLSPMVREKLWKETISTNYGGKWRLKQLDSHIPEHTYTWYYCIRAPPLGLTSTFFDIPDKILLSCRKMLYHVEVSLKNVVPCQSHVDKDMSINVTKKGTKILP